MKWVMRATPSERVADSRYPVLSGLFAAQRRVALALEVGERELYDTYREREEQPLQGDRSADAHALRPAGEREVGECEQDMAARDR